LHFENIPLIYFQIISVVLTINDDVSLVIGDVLRINTDDLKTDVGNMKKSFATNNTPLNEE
jgi:hypothetical protein